MIFCPKCGRELPDDAAFCASCGAKITVPAEAPAVTEPVVEKPIVEESVKAEEPVPAAPPAEPKKPAEPEPVKEIKEPEKPAKKEKRTAESEPPAGSAALAAVGFASAFIAPFAAIILCALAKKKCGREHRRSTYSKLAGWGLFFGIVFTAATILFVAGYVWFGPQFINKLMHYCADIIKTFVK